MLISPRKTSSFCSFISFLLCLKHVFPSFQVRITLQDNPTTFIPFLGIISSVSDCKLSVNQNSLWLCLAVGDEEKEWKLICEGEKEYALTFQIGPPFFSLLYFSPLFSPVLSLFEVVHSSHSSPTNIRIKI